MTLYYFNGLAKMEQIEAIWYHGARLADREDKAFRYVLFRIDSFFIEGKFHKAHNIHPFFTGFISDNAAMLQPYLPKLDNPGAFREDLNS